VVDEATLTPTQKANLNGIKLLAEISPIEFHIFRSEKSGKTFKYTMADGTVVTANGWYVAGTNEIWVDINAGNAGEGTMVRTAAHEISHYIKQWSPKKWGAMADLIMAEFAKNGVDTEGMLSKKLASLKKRNPQKSDTELLDLAHEEVVSDALTDMLTDGSIVNFMAEVKMKDRSLYKKIVDAIKSLLKKWGLIIDDYKGKKLDAAEAQALSQLEDTFKKLQEMYRDAFMDANEAFEAIGSRNLADLSQAKNTDGESLFQYRAMEADEATYRDMLKKWGKMSDTQINNLFTTIDKAMDIIKDNLEALDYAWESDINDRAFSPVKPNSDSLYQVSLDFSTLCRKRILQQTVQAQLQDALNKPLTREEGIAIRDALMALQEEGRQIEVACALCYVESARMKSPAQIKKFLGNREAVIKDFFAGKAGGSMKSNLKQAETDAREKIHEENPGGIKGKDGSMLDPRVASLKAMPKKYADEIRSAKRKAKEAYNPTAEEQRIIDVAKGMTVSDFTSPEGLENLAKNYPALFDAYTSYIRNATKSKGIEGDTWWRAGDSERIGDVLIANMNRENGLRSQSWSDFQVIHILDYIAATIELSTRNAKEQAYSKVPDYVELMGQTGVMINMSLIPTRDFNGSLEYDSIEGMAYKRALELRDKYPATAGTICIGIDNKQIQMLLADKTIDYVIPYHKSGMAATVRKLMHIPTWSQYEEYQSEKSLPRKEAEAQAKKYGVTLLAENDPNYHKHTAFSEWFDLEVAKQIAKMENANPSNKAMQKEYGVMYGGYMAMQDAANNYLKMCAERGIAPKFSHEKADFTSEANYWKLLIDRKMVNNATGEVIEQQTIKPVFDEGEVLRILNDELEKYPSVKADQDYATRKVTEKFLSGEIKSGMSADAIAKVMQKPVDNITKTNIVASAEGEKLFSERDSVGNELSKEQAEFFKDSKVRDKDGNLLVMYHGTSSDVKFTVFERRKMVNGKNFGDGFYFTEDENAAYSWGSKNVYEVYVDIKNPYIASSVDGETPDVIVEIVKERYGESYDRLSNDPNWWGNKFSRDEYIEQNSGSWRNPDIALISAVRTSDIPYENDAQYYGEIARRKTELLESLGYDGVIVPSNRLNRTYQEIVAFNSNQIKLTTNTTPTSDPDIRYSFRGTNKDGIEVYETGDDVRNLPYKERQKQFLYIMNNEYRGRTAKFIRNGHAYYATFDEKDVNKNIYGDKRSDEKGWKAKINVGADGNIFELVENAQYDGSKREKGKQITAHRGVGYWDYFIKNVQIDGAVFDLVANVRKKTDGAFVYSIQLNENKKIKASPPLGSLLRASSGVTNAYGINVSQPAQNVNKKYQDRGTSNRTILANALEGAVQNDIERNKLAQYKEQIDLLDAEQQKLSDLRREIKNISFSKGKRDTVRLRELQDEAARTANRIGIYDRQLLKLEAAKPLQDVLLREKEQARKKQRELDSKYLKEYKESVAKTQREIMTRYHESRKKATESRNKTAMRHKIRKVVNDLNQLLLHGTRDKHVMENLQKSVAMALDAVNMDTVGAEERIAKLNVELVKAKAPEQIHAIYRKIENIQMMGDRMNDRLTALKNAYNEIKNSEDPIIANSYDEVITGRIEYVVEQVGDTPLRDMTLQQLEDVYDMYKMVLTTIRNSNKSFKAAKNESIATLGERTMGEVARVGGSKAYVLSALDKVKKYGWNALKPIYAFRTIGSNTLTDIYNNVRAGEDTWAMDVSEAKAFYEEKTKKYKYDSWDFKKSHSFNSLSGKKFDLTLEQIMSLYAYSKRQQADLHLRYGGFVFDSSIETQKVKENGKKSVLKYKVNTATAFNLSAENLAEIVGALTDEQKAFVDEMQAYLSDTMGAKGNEVSLELYGVKLFKEKHYFPLKSAKQFMFERNEVAGEIKVKNSGFSKETVPKAKNPIILNNFTDVWTNHVNDMSMYHSFVLPLEDFNRVFNYHTPANMEQESVKMYLQNAYGEQVNQYISELLKDLNGGARVDSTAGIINQSISMFKKSAVYASASVVIQQPSAIARAWAYIDPKYFAFTKMGIRHHGRVWSEVKKYAPVAIIKEMGRFDTHIGQQTTDWIKGDKTFVDKVDDFLSKAPALADEISWCYIWNATKKEVKANHPGLDGEALLKKAGERFTEVITLTQVYDSVLSRSGMMRSKDTGMKMATAFMAEPTTSMNMMVDAMIQGKRGDKRGARKAVGAVAASIILNSILVSLIYAARDDDEDKTYAEKYVGSLSSELIDGFNPITYIPFVKDIWSIAQGYDVERSDMSLYSKLWQSVENLFKENLSAEEKVIDFAGSVSSIFGLPTKNITRDAKAIYNVVDGILNGEKTTSAGVGTAIADAARSSVPLLGRFYKADTKSTQLYNAIISGDEVQIERMKARFKDKSAIDSALRQALRENDTRIREAAEARMNGDMARYKEIGMEIKAEGYFSQDIIVGAINNEIQKIKDGQGGNESSGGGKSVPVFTAADYYNAIVNGDYADINAVKEYLIESGKTESQIASGLNSAVKDAYEKGEITKSKAVSIMASRGGKSEYDADIAIGYVDFKAKYPEYKDIINEDKYANYYEAMTDYHGYSLADMGISFSAYAEYCKSIAGITGTDANGDGKTDSGSKKYAIMRVINSLPLTYDQKNALYFSNGWAASKLYEAPWY
jgi:hypothetical protein